MIKQAAALGSQTAALIRLAPVHGKLTTQWRQVAEHELATLDIRRTRRPHDIHPDRKERVSVGSDQPPSAVSVLGSKKSCRAKAALSRKPPIAVAFGGIGAPPRQLRRFFVTPGAKHFGRADFLRPSAEMKLAETIDDPVIGGLIPAARGLDAQGADV